VGDIPAELRAKLEDRVREQIATEVRGDVSALYEFTLPSIRAHRIAERDDEPELSLSSIREFVGLIREAQVESIRVESFEPSLSRHGGCPAAFVVTEVRYNGDDGAHTFRCVWVYSESNWFTTSLGKRRFAGVRSPPSQ
jgi:hypothetical protein